ncbi:MAG TPA: hypothetical protein VGP07_23000 [Polyangia bacterium]|jgi:hypothetical protein
MSHRDSRWTSFAPALSACTLAFAVAAMMMMGCTSETSCGDAAASAGAGGAGGGGGAGGQVVAASPAVGCGDPEPGTLDYLDDMEDGNAMILGRDGRNGYWYTYHDTTEGTLNPPQGTEPTMEVIPGGRCGVSTHAMRVTGSGFTDWGAGFGFDLRDGINDAGASGALAYDGTRFSGFTFWGKIGDTSISTLRIGVGDQWSRPEGGTCTVDPTSGPNACYDSFGASFTLTNVWQRYSIDFGQLQQRSFGLPRPALDTTALMTLEFGIPPASPVFDIWIDDLAFF